MPHPRCRVATGLPAPPPLQLDAEFWVILLRHYRARFPSAAPDPVSLRWSKPIRNVGSETGSRNRWTVSRHSNLNPGDQDWSTASTPLKSCTVCSPSFAALPRISLTISRDTTPFESGRIAPGYPVLGSAVAKLLEKPDDILPGYISIRRNGPKAYTDVAVMPVFSEQNMTVSGSMTIFRLKT